jgi:beta-N-acetylglucosaminidase
MRKVSSCILVVFMIFFSIFIPSNIVQANTLPARIYLDTPINNTVINNNITIAGWALNSSGIREVNIFVDNSLIGKATTGISRPDVDRAFPGYRDGDKSGFTYQLDIRQVPSGTRVIRVEAVGNDGVRREVQRSVNVVKNQPRIYLDTPARNITLSDNILISGWSLNASGVREVQVYLNNLNNLVGKANINLSRPDVDRAFPGYKDGDKSGFEFNLQLSPNISHGSHTVIVRSVGFDGETVSTSFIVNKPEPRSYIDSPRSNTVYRDNVEVSGWALNYSGIKEINILVNGQNVGQANTGISRPDVNKAFPGYRDGANSGFNYTIDINTLRRGNNNVRVQAVGNDNVIRESNITINVEKPAPKMYIDTPTNNSFLREGTEIRGWALNASGVREVEVYLNGGKTPLGKGIIGINRPDVNNAFPGYKDGDKSGFSFPLDINSIPSGVNTLRVRAIGNDGDIIERVLTLTKAQPLLTVESPTQGQNFRTGIIVRGWALNATGIREVSVYDNERLLGTANIGISRPDVNSALNQNGRYKDGAQSGFEFEVDINNLNAGTHLLVIKAIGNDGEVRTASVVISTGNVVINYVNYNITFNEFINRQMGNTPAMHVYNNATKQWEWRYARIVNGQPGYFVYDSLNREVWTHSAQQYEAIRAEMIKNTDPLNSMYDQRRIYQFLKLSYVEGTTAAELNSVFNPNGVFAGKGQVFLDAAKAHNINPIYLAAHAVLETGNGTSNLARGIIVNGVRVHNVFGILAFDHNPDGAGSQFAFQRGWTDVDKAIFGGAEWISKDYINNTKHNQDTLYKMRWNPANPTVHQYATDVNWAIHQTRILESYFGMFKDARLVFEIPVFNK